MTLNICSRAEFPCYSSEDRLVLPTECGIFRSIWSSDWELQNSNNFDWEMAERGGFHVMDYDDIVNLLPADPFGMDIRSTFTTISGWLDDLKDVELYSHRKMDEPEAKDESPQSIGLDFIWNDHRKIQSEMGNLRIYKHPIICDGYKEVVMDNGLYIGGVVSGVNAEVDLMSFNNIGDWVFNDQARGLQDCAKTSPDCEGDAPHDALFFALGYLGVKDLLSVERVCRSLRDVVRSDPLLWRSIHIDHPLSEKVTDDALLQLTSRAQGTLHCLSLVKCVRITNGGLKRLLECNPGLRKLSVPGCVRLSVEGILFYLKAFKSAGILQLKHLRIGGLSGVTNKHFEELRFLLEADNSKQLRNYKPLFHRNGQFYIPCDDDRAIDIEMCPRCQKLGLVYDCPTESCQRKHQTADLCRACVLCIRRCFECGRCIKDSAYVESFTLDWLCLDCGREVMDGWMKMVILPSSIL